MPAPRTKRKPAKPVPKTPSTKAYWSGRVTRESHALALEEGVFTWSDPKRIARSLKRSAEESTARKAEPYRSALSMLVFYINRAGKNLPARQRRVLEQAKLELKKQFHRA
jgi:putative cell wall-binding protein